MGNYLKCCIAMLFVASLATCSGDGDTVVEREPVDYSGTWVGDCVLADTSLVPNLGAVYYNDQLRITQNSITTGTAVFSDSDCVTLMDVPFARNVLFDEGEYTLLEAVTTESGLTAWSLEIQVEDGEETIPNIIAISNEILYFGYSLFDGAANDAQLELRELDLDNGYRRQ